MAKKKHYTVSEAARELKITRSAVHLAVKKGKLNASWGKTTQVIEALLIDSKDLEAYRVDLTRQRSGKKS